MIPTFMANLRSGDILIQACGGIFGLLTKYITGCHYVRCGIYNKTENKVYWRSIFGLHKSDIEKWKYSLIMRHRSLPPELIARQADDVIGLEERLEKESDNYWAVPMWKISSSYVDSVYTDIGYNLVYIKYARSVFDILDSNQLKNIGIFY